MELTTFLVLCMPVGVEVLCSFLTFFLGKFESLVEGFFETTCDVFCILCIAPAVLLVNALCDEFFAVALRAVAPLMCCCLVERDEFVIRLTSELVTSVQ